MECRRSQRLAKKGTTHYEELSDDDDCMGMCSVAYDSILVLFMCLYLRIFLVHF